VGVKRQWIVAAPLAVELVWHDDRLAQARLDWSKNRKAEKNLDGLAEEMAVALARYVRGEDPDWPDMPLDMGGLSDFSRAVLSTLADEVPAGETVTYGELASMCGRPAAARAVGRVMASNPWPLIVPCHRVVGSSGDLVGFSGCGLDMKRFLLQVEGAL
jgi:methylated-DNA-[protein]-cysteine S-methyltransferase